MKTRFLLLFALLLLCTPHAEAEDWDRTFFSYDADVNYKQEAAQYIKYVEDKWVLYKIGKESVEKVERATKAEYRSRRVNFDVQLAIHGLKPSIQTKLKVKGLPIYMVFNFTQ